MKQMKMSLILTLSALLCASCSSFYSNHGRVKPMPLAQRQAPADRMAQNDEAQTRGARFGDDLNERDEAIESSKSAQRASSDSDSDSTDSTAEQKIVENDESSMTKYKAWAAKTQNPKCLICQDTAGTEQHYFFELNKADIDNEFMTSVKNQARFLLSHPDVKVRIEGNADERGSREYNVALAARRAKAVVDLFKQQGVPTRQYSMVSYGAEKPASKGEDEESYHCNRRVDIIYEVDSNA